MQSVFQICFFTSTLSPLRQFHPITWRSSLFGYFITISSLIYEEPLPAPPPRLLSILLLKHRKGTFKASVLAYTLFSLSLSIPTISTPPLNNAVFICLFRSPLQLNPWAFSSWANLNWYPFRFQTFRSCPKIYSPSFPPFPTVFPQQWFLIVLLFLLLPQTRTLPSSFCTKFTVSTSNFWYYHSR